MTTASPLVHETVLLAEAVEGLAVRPEGIYLDATFGRGGHSAAILAKLGAQGRLFATDRDVRAKAAADALAATDTRLQFKHVEFSQAADWLASLGLQGRVDGVLFDLGVSSPQIDEAARGFSFQQNGPLDMRMNQQAGQTAAEWLALAEEEAIANVLYQLGDEKFSRRIARRIVETRSAQPLRTTFDLVRCIVEATPRQDPRKHPATRSFQAIRLHINRELDEITQSLAQIVDLLSIGGRLVVISFHSLEDRIVKNFMRDESTTDKDFFGQPMGTARLKRVGGSMRASAAEIARNPRSRSAIMRIAERVA
ncbi:MAG: 16S rRNA (cytosine(1402)-N(4))-methyltransferase [Halothiobacillus sp. 24-54-40]|jgi:16S rRNA (cytosine1402-N4)-methyltransferase|nr:MAG: 16S rRNA (cytosine(1402)-N(4))-methyltransferase [Halothiobacillus sp. 35-54-62]OYZ86870.1 MAG: 16S rRNA (cytosine(1402)-N(4))-methyltransferase [Halothiobacillus sp. 24-54-40]OZA79886.1 MAG: 16S rRNA (cytosine(1402)-N(4))-methyltransferase [Halothiobacillus sp. 39-53-45]HQS02481.1 16S rRNA (cytosine(1402)-N(4))-methyltransferase RsmH [Halothiobacillus sp.]HQS29086.1 16S rRNA (cytosine(1402)-N(4))-methyltransferase RsmH [Halothiobacillus sp.]